MGKLDRRKELLFYLAEHDVLYIDDAVKLFGASPATLRRDFAELAGSGMVGRTRGGIRRMSDCREQPLPLLLREQWYSDEKRRLAEHAFEHIRTLKSLFIDGGSTTAHLGMLLNDPEQTVVTNSLAFCSMLSRRFPNGGGPRVFLTGGHFYPESGLLLGSNAEHNVERYHADAAVISARGIDYSAVYNNNELVSGIGRAMTANSARTIVIADHSKIGISGMHRVCGLESVSLLITAKTPENAASLNLILSSGKTTVETL